MEAVGGESPALTGLTRTLVLFVGDFVTELKAFHLPNSEPGVEVLNPTALPAHGWVGEPELGMPDWLGGERPIGMGSDGIVVARRRL